MSSRSGEGSRNDLWQFLAGLRTPDEVADSLAPRGLVNLRRLDPEGEHPVSAPLPTDNLLIKGDNLPVLHTLSAHCRDAVKLIYIDPPYNTGTNGLGYRDRFDHGAWLAFMRDRLEVARLLMRPNGVIFMHIGDQEMHYLKVLADGIFGREHFLGTIPRKTRYGKSDVPRSLSQDFDWLLVYTRAAPRDEALFKRTIRRKYHTSDDFPGDPWRLADLTTQRTIDERPNSNFTLVNPRNGEGFPVNPNRSWAVTKDSVDGFLARHKIVFPGDYDFLRIRKPAMRVFRSEEIARKGADFDKTFVSSDFLNQAMDDLMTNTHNRRGTDEIVALFGEKAFAYPKNELLLQRIIEYTTVEGDLVLDFFLGSGTTAAVAHKMGRQYIGVEQTACFDTTAVPRLTKVIAGKQGGISQDVGWQGGGSVVVCASAPGRR